ncbi:hypothetical protein MLD38_001952 [Melastoma candidum]|uniref:Uncharacterized protein n=1 Tax=Melastoma candidum TaxID=119954 RepID=A0ACB9SED3_9MYRT|nr:hypothetical protein MLD38_001952 [Melastoma candidum]
MRDQKVSLRNFSFEASAKLQHYGRGLLQIHFRVLARRFSRKLKNYSRRHYHPSLGSASAVGEDMSASYLLRPLLPKGRWIESRHPCFLFLFPFPDRLHTSCASVSARFLLSLSRFLISKSFVLRGIPASRFPFVVSAIWVFVLGRLRGGGIIGFSVNSVGNLGKSPL